MPAAQADRNLLFGILALQMDFIDRDQLVAAMRAWVLDRSRSLGEVLVARGSLDPGLLELLEPMVAAHVEQHGGDPARSLASLSTLGPVAVPLTVVDDPDVQASLARVSAGGPVDDPNATRLPSAGSMQGAGLNFPFEPDPRTNPGLRFRILRPHARGGIGVVSVAHDRELNREVALKEIQERHADEPTSRARFLMEAEVTGGLEHPGIVPVYGLGHHSDGRPYYAMRFIRGDSLKEAIERFHRGEWEGSATRTLEMRKLLRRFLDVCDAIDYAHNRGVLHRDLKPGNIMLGKFGETLVVDWGLAKTLGDSDPDRQTDERPLETSSASGSAETLPGSTIGTPAFMSPEQASGDLDKLGPSSDVYSLGATLYSLLTGRLPIESPDIAEVLRRVRIGDFPPPRRVDRRVDPALDAICRKAMALKPEDRYPSARDLADDLEHWLADEPVSAHPEPVSDRLARWSRRHRTLVISATAILLTVTSGSAWIYKERLERHTAEAEQVASEKEAERANELALASKKEAEQANKVAQIRQYHNLLGQAREDRRGGRPGWTWDARESLGRAAGLDSAELDPIELRTEAAAGLGELDLRQRSKLVQEMTAHCLAFSPDGRQLAIAQSKAQAYAICSVKVVDLKTNEVTRTLTFTPPFRWLTSKAVQDGSRAVAFGPDGRLAVGARSGRVHCWNLSEANPVPVSWDAHPGGVTGLAFSPDGGVLYTGSIDRTVKRWDMTKPGRSAPGQTHVFQSPGEIRDLSLDRDGLTLAASGAGIVHLLDSTNLRPKDHAIPPGGGRVALSPDGRTLAIDRGGLIELVAPEGDLSIAKLQDARLGEASGATLSGLSFSPDGSMLVTACSADDEHAVKLWDVASARLVATINVGGADNLDAAFGPDGRTLAATGEHGAWVFDIGGPDVRESVAFHPRPLLAIDLAPHGRTLASLSGTEVRGAKPTGVEVRLWDLLDGPLAIRQAEVPEADKPHGVAFDAEGRLMAYRGAGPRVEFWGLPGTVYPKPMDVESLTAFGLSADGTRLWAVAKDDLISRNVADGALRTRWSNLSSMVLTGLSGLTCLSVGRDWIVVGGSDGFVRLIRAEDGQPHATWNPDRGPVRCVGLSPDEAFVATGSPTGWVTMFGRESGEKVASWNAHSQPVQSVCFSDDGRWLASGSVDRVVRLYRREGDEWGEWMTLPEASGSVRTVRFGPGGKTLAVLVDGERAVRVWHLDRLRERLASMGLDRPDAR